jgi:hypothetical protein
MDAMFFFGIAIVILGFLCWAWVRGIDNMMRDFPDYKGEDLFDEEPPKKKNESDKTDWEQDGHHTKQRI